MYDPRQYIEAMAKHLPPSAATLRLLDVGGAAGGVLSSLRSDLDITAEHGLPQGWHLSPDSVDAVVAYNYDAGPVFLRTALLALRPGGRLVIGNPNDRMSETWVNTLESAGYTRILVEPIYAGVLMRGEKPHTELRTYERIQQTASRDPNALDLTAYSGRYVHLLIRQTPNKPAWRLAPGEQIEWQAVALSNDHDSVMLAFSSLPKAVAFMQPAVMAGRIKDVNKVAKFTRETAQQWASPVMLNPTLDAIEGHSIVLVPVDPQTAETSDE